MKKALYFIIAIFEVTACTRNGKVEQASPSINIDHNLASKKEKQFDKVGEQKEHKKNVPTNNVLYYCDSTIINGIKFKACTKSENSKLYIIEVGGDTTAISIEYGGPEFSDFNEDGYEDLYIHYMTNVPDIFDIALYNPRNKKFELIKNLQSFPASQKISGTKFYYSYHRSGCADMNWDSDLFYIKNNKAIIVGNIEGLGCADQKQRISIHIIRGESKDLIESFPIDTLDSYENFKWGFIKDYWTKNHNLFN